MPANRTINQTVQNPLLLDHFISYRPVFYRLDFENRPELGWGLPLLPGQDGEEQRGGQEEGQGETPDGGGQVCVKQG